MGCRGAIVIQEAQFQCVFTAHLWGFDVERRAAKGLRRALESGRDHTDPDYLRRILFDALTDYDTSALGFGIGHVVPLDLEYPPVVVEVYHSGLVVNDQPVEMWLKAHEEATRR
jgi:hypothetical protein